MDNPYFLIMQVPYKRAAVCENNFAETGVWEARGRDMKPFFSKGDVKDVQPRRLTFHQKPPEAGKGVFLVML